MSLSTTSKRFLNTSRDGDSTTSLESLFQCLTTLSVKKFFLIFNLKLPWRNLRPFPLILSQWKETNPTLAVSTFQILEESNEVSHQPPFLQTKQPQFLLSKNLPQWISKHMQALHLTRGPKMWSLRPLHCCQITKCWLKGYKNVIGRRNVLTLILAYS